MLDILCLRGFLFKYLMLIMWYKSISIYYHFPFRVFSSPSFITTVFPYLLYSYFTCFLLPCFIPNIVTSYTLYSIVTSTRTSPLLFFWWFALFWKILVFQTFGIMVGSCSWVIWICRLRWSDKIVVIKTPVTDHKRSSQKSERIALFEKPQVLQNHRHAWELLY